MRRNQRQARLQRSGRTNVFAKGRLSKFRRHRQNQHEHYQQKIFHVQKSAWQFQFRRRDFIQQLLNQSERAQETADGSTKQQAD